MIRSRFLLLIIFSPSLCFGSCAYVLDPPEVDSHRIGIYSGLITPPVQTIVVSRDLWYNRDFKGVWIKDETLGSEKSKLVKELTPFLNRSLNTEDLIEIEKTVTLRYRKADMPLISLTINKPSLKMGVLVIEVKENVAGSITCVGNRYFSDHRIRGYISQKEGEPVDPCQLAYDLEALNANPFRQTDVLFKPGLVPGTSNIELLTRDRRTYRIYAGGDNTGVEVTGSDRWFTGLNCGNLFYLDHRCSYQFTSGSNYNDFHAHTGQYILPFFWKHILSFYGGYSVTRAKSSESPNFYHHGQSSQVSARYEIPLMPYRRFLHSITIGYDWKNTNVNLSFQGTPLLGNTVNVSQFMLDYNAGYENSWLKTSLFLEAFCSPGRMLPNQKKDQFQTLRAFANPYYWYFRGEFNPLFRLPCYSFGINLAFRGQYATNNLLSSEQFSLGGYNTVRGYDERQVNGDSAILFNGEILSPIFPLFLRNKTGKFRDSMEFLAFYDNGTAYIHRPAVGEARSINLQGIGAGVRYYLEPVFNVRCDLGYRIKAVPGENRGFRTHFSFIFNY